MVKSLGANHENPYQDQQGHCLHVQQPFPLISVLLSLSLMKISVCTEIIRQDFALWKKSPSFSRRQHSNNFFPFHQHLSHKFGSPCSRQQNLGLVTDTHRAQGRGRTLPPIFLISEPSFRKC